MLLAELDEIKNKIAQAKGGDSSIQAVKYALVHQQNLKVRTKLIEDQIAPVDRLPQVGVKKLPPVNLN